MGVVYFSSLRAVVIDAAIKPRAGVPRLKSCRTAARMVSCFQSESDLDVGGVARVEALVVWRLCVAVEAGCDEAALCARVRVAETPARGALRPMRGPAKMIKQPK